MLSKSATTKSPATPGLPLPANRVVSGYRPELQGLRAVAVIAVVLYHLWPNRVTGGFVGVDVFFVISGYLITGHMYRELMGKGLSLIQFWGRRIRRLLPAAFLVLFVSLAAAYLWIPATLWESTGHQVGASALYMQNWVLAAESVDYSAQNAAATVSQHYWSLSIEEQFYIFWPLIMVALLWSVSQLTKGVPAVSISARTTLITGLSIIGAISLFYSIYATASNPAAAYFVTPTRVWEFAIGALVALVFLDRQFSGPVATVLAWAGLAAILISALLYNSQTPFPGSAALVPVVGTALLLCCSGRTSLLSPTWFLSRRTATFIGDISYAVYLWHWPLIIVTPFALKTELNWSIKLGILGFTILLSWVTKLLLEDPLRKGTLLRSNLRTYSFTALGMVLIAGLSFGLTALANAPIQVESETQSASCSGPRALNPDNDCASILGDSAPNPAAVAVSKQNTEPRYPGCQASFEGTELVTCDLGAPAAAAKTTVAIVGDSHATAWFPAMDELGKKHGWRVVTYSKSSCPLTNALRVQVSEKTDENQLSCHEWNMKLNKELTSSTEISAIFTAAFSSAYSFKASSSDTMANPSVEGFTSMWAGWQASGKKVVVFDDVPRTNGQYIPTCLSTNADDPMKCALPVSQALPASMAITEAAKVAEADGITRISLRNEFCDTNWCYPVIGQLIVYRDYSHLSEEYSRALVPYIDAQLGAAKIGQ
ncbi:acyltransferase family protein [Arthrobacter sp. Sr24]